MAQLRNADITYVTDEHCASELRLFKYPWEFEPKEEWSDLDKKQFFMRLSLLRKKPILELSMEDFLMADLKKGEIDDPNIFAIKRYNLWTLCNWRADVWDGIKKSIVIKDIMATPEEVVQKEGLFAKKLGLDGKKAKFCFIVPHPDDIFLAMMDQVEAICNAGHEVSVYILAKGYTAVADNYALDILRHIKTLGESKLSQYGKMNEEDFKEKEEALLNELIEVCRDKIEVWYSDPSARRDVHDYDPWKEPNTRKTNAESIKNINLKEKALRSELLFLRLNRMLGWKLTNSKKVGAVVDFLVKASEEKPMWEGNKDLMLMQDIKTFIRMNEEQAALMNLGVGYSNIHLVDSSWYGEPGRGGTANEEDLDDVGVILLKEEPYDENVPYIIVSNGEGFSDHRSHGITESEVLTEVLRLKKAGKLKSVKHIIQFAGVWEWIRLYEAQLALLLTHERIERFVVEFEVFYASQFPATVPDSNFTDIISFSEQVRAHTLTSSGALATYLGDEGLMDRYGVLNLKILDVGDSHTMEKMAERAQELEDVRDALKEAVDWSKTYCL